MPTKKGFSTLLAIFALIIITTVGVCIHFLLNSEEKRQKISRIRFEMARAETQARNIFSKPQAYTACSQSGLKNLWTCTLVTQQVNSLNRVIVGPPCGAPFCGISAAAVFVAHATQPKVTFTFIYTGTDVRVAKSQFDFDIPKEAYQGANGICGIDKDGDGVVDGYLYKGIDADGNDLCNGLPACPEYTFFSGLNADGSAKCTSLTNNLSKDTDGTFYFQCPAQQYLKGLNFSPLNTPPIITTCEAQIDPCKVSDDGGKTICPPKGY